MNQIKEKLNHLIQKNIKFSDVLIKANDVFLYRDPAGLQVLGEEVIDDREIDEFLKSIKSSNTDFDKEIAENGGHLDFALTYVDVRFRCNLFHFNGNRAKGMSLRRLSSIIPSLAQLNAPKYLLNFAQRSTGLVLVTGATGSGKSTTLASLIDYVNNNYNSHIITLEDPIEYKHKNKKSSVTQRELGEDVSSFAQGLKAALREDPDVILIGEIRDRETAAAALEAAETGHLVFSTLHTTSAPKTIERMVDFFDGAEKEMMRTVMSSVLAGVCSQILIPNKEKTGRVLVCEIMGNTTQIANDIRKGEFHRLENGIRENLKDGMTLMNRELVTLVQDGIISKDVALYATHNPIELRKELGER